MPDELKKVVLKDLQGNQMFPKTYADVVLTADGTGNLGTVEPGAEVNIIETVKVNGVALTPDSNRAVDVTFDTDTYTIAKLASGDTGYSSDYAAQYQLKKGNTLTGQVINIPKDMVISAGELKICETANNPVTGLAVGDPYIQLTIANNDGTKINIPVKDLVDVYTAGDDTITVANNTIKVNLTELGKTFAAKIDADHKLAGNLVDMTGYQKASSVSAVATTDTVPEAIGKLEKALDGKEATIALTGNRAVVSDANGKLAASAVTDTEIGYLDGVTSNIQNQLDAKVATANVQSAYTTDNTAKAYPINSQALTNLITYEVLS